MFVRRGETTGRWLGARMSAFSLGAVLALLGMALGRDWLVVVAGVVLLAGVLLGLAARRLDQRAAPTPSDDDIAEDG